MSFFAVVAYSIVMVCLGYMIGVSDGKVEGRIESFQRDKR
jgi:hypothetical protein